MEDLQVAPGLLLKSLCQSLLPLSHWSEKDTADFEQIATLSLTIANCADTHKLSLPCSNAASPKNHPCERLLEWLRRCNSLLRPGRLRSVSWSQPPSVRLETGAENLAQSHMHIRRHARTNTHIPAFHISGGRSRGWWGLDREASVCTSLNGMF